MEEKKITEIDWEKHIRSYEENDMLDDHGPVAIGSREKNQPFWTRI